MSSSKTTSLDEFTNQMQLGLNELSETTEISLGELLTDEFMQEHTSFSSIDELFESAGFTVETEEDLAAIPEDILDNHIAKTTSFDNWEDMLDEAVAEFTCKKLGL